jgi:hypothetical protein
MKLSIIFASLVVLSTSAFAGVSDTVSAGLPGLYVPGRCEEFNVMKLINDQRSIDESLEKLMTLINNSQDKEQINIYQIHIGILRAEYLKCDLVLKHLLLNNK